MKIVVFDGTHNKDGATLGLVAAFLKGFLSIAPQAELIEFDLLAENINFCSGCNCCTKDKDPIKANCSIDDGVSRLIEQGLAADVIVLASPIYEYCVSSVMKRFLERCLPLVTFKAGPAPRSKPTKLKYGVVICSSGAPFPLNWLMGITRYPHFILKLASRLFGCSKTKVIMAGAPAMGGRLEAYYQAKAQKLGVLVASRLNLNR